MTAKPDNEQDPPEAVLQSYIDRLDPKIQKLARSVRAAIRKRLPAANELAYDYKTFVVLSYSPTDRGIDGVVSIAARPDGVRLYLNPGPQLPDPKKLLQGAGKQARFVSVEAASDLAHPDIKALIDAAIDQAEIPLPSEGQGRLILRSEGAKPRSRKPRK
ncbi:MAG TPA: hypothetical protein VN851_03805 [Thermoanaerobaculia bacterium]|nr:hypothetical protein [Thermoanaerobaculia bacterium]